MNGLLLAFLLGIGLSIITVLGDVLVKSASLQPGFSGWQVLVVGAIIYGLTAFGWFFVMRGAKLSTLGVLYAVSVVVFLTLVSVFYFKEKLSIFEVLGITMAITSLVILYRFS
jgi:drug/metabolite transporter (DMT)-like permease